MGTENILERSASMSVEGWNLPPWIELILGKVRRALLTEDEKRLLHLAEFGAATFGRSLLESKDLDDLDDRIEALLEKPELTAFNTLVLSSVRDEKLEAQVTSQVTMQDILDWGVAAPDLFAQAINLSVLVMQFRRKLAMQIGAQDMPQALGNFGSQSLTSLCLDKSVPNELGMIFFAWFRADLCSLAFCEMVMSKQRVEPWLAKGIAQRWVDGARKYLCLIASFRGADVPLDLVSEADRIDLPRTFAEHRAARERMDRFVEEGIASGLPVYAPDFIDDD